MKLFKVLFLLVQFILAGIASAESKIAVPDFELLDLTMRLSDPAKVAEINAQEQQKLRMIEDILRNGLNKIDGFSLLDSTTEQRNAADKSTGYLFDCAACSAEFGRELGADYIVIGRHHKPTYLFSYIIVRIFDTANNTLVKEYRSEVKGDPNKAIPGATYNLISKIDKILPH